MRRRILLQMALVLTFFIIGSWLTPAAGLKSKTPYRTEPQQKSRTKAQLKKKAQETRRTFRLKQEQDLAKINLRTRNRFKSHRSDPRPIRKLIKLQQKPLPRNAHELLRGPDWIPPPDAPRISSLNPEQSIVGENLTITGEKFGSRGSVTIQISRMNVLCAQIRWTDRQIVVTIPAGLAPNVGESPKEARIWIDAPGGLTTRPIRLAPNPADLRPSITRVYESPLRPGQVFNVYGSGFLTERPGTVDLRLREPGRTFHATIHEWLDSVIQASLPADIDGVPACPGILTVRNHAGLEPLRATVVQFLPTLEAQTLEESQRFSGGFSGGRSDILTFFDFVLINGWVVEEADYTYSARTSGRSRASPSIDAVRLPERGNRYAQCSISIYCPEAWTAVVDCTLTIVGPVGLPYRR